jgi:Flp pilus assembly protein TadG
MKLKKFVQGAEGSIMVITALGLVVFLGFASLAIDMGRLYVAKNELQNTADAAALAGTSHLITQQNGQAVRDDAAAKQAVMDVAQRQSELLGQTPLEPEARNDVTVVFGEWNIYAGNPDTAWTPYGSTCGAYSNANGVQVTLRRGSDLAYGPVTNLLSGILGDQFRTTEVAVTATAFLGFVTGAQTGSVNLPLAIPDTVMTAANQDNRSWWAKLLGPSEAVATGPKQLTFRDLGSDSFYVNNLNKPLFDTDKAYLVTVNTSDSLPGTVIDNIEYTYQTSGVKPVRPMEVGTRLYPLSEYKWAGNIKTIFNRFKNAYNANKDSNGKWRVMVPVYAPTQSTASRVNQGLKMMARWFSFGPSPAHACFTFSTQTYPGGNVPIEVKGFANVDVVNVTYTSDCYTCSDYSPYLNTTDCMVNNPESCRNTNSVTVEIPVDSSTVSPPGTESGGPDNQHITPGGETKQGALAAIPRLVK